MQNLWNLHIGSCEDGWGDKSEMSADVQVSWHDSTVHV